MKLPNLVIAGAPKCGTSSLFRWLADHPEAFGSTVKETFYLMDEGHPLLRKDSNFHKHGLNGYGAYFKGCSKSHRVVFEATTHYIYQQTAIKVLSELLPAPQIVFVLRKPSDRVYSSFRYTKNNLANMRRDVTFSQFIDLVRNKPDSPLIEAYAGASAYVLKNDIGYSRYVEYVSPWAARFGSERVHVLLFEDMIGDPRAFMKDLSRRLQIDSVFYDDYDFPVRNETFSLRYLALHRRVRKLNGLLPQGKLKRLLRNIYLKAQSGQTENGKTAEDRQTLAELDREFQPFNQRLADELGLDLSAWN